MRSRLLLFLLLLLPAWAAWAQAPAWQNAYGVPANARATAAATNAAGDVFITGTYSSATTFGSTQLPFAGGSFDVFLAKWSNASRTFVWAVSVGGTGTDQAGDVAVNGTSVYLTGGYKGSATISGTPQTSVGTGTFNIFVAKYTDGGSSVSNGGSVSSGNTGTRTSYGSGIAVSGTSVYVTGTFGTSATIAGTPLTGTAGSFFLARYVDSNGLTNGGAVTASSTATVRGLDVAVSGTSPINIYVTGFYRTSAANTGVTTISGTGLSSDGINDVFLAKYTDSGSGITDGGAVKAGGSDGADTGQAVAVSGSSVYVIGSYGSTTGTFGSSTLTNPSGGSNGLAPAQGFVAKYVDGGNTLTGSTAYVIGNPTSAANSSDSAVPLGVAASGSTVYVTGSFSGSVNISGTPLSTSNGSEIFLGKYTDAGGAFSQDGAIRAGGTGNGSTGFDDVGYAVAFSGRQGVVVGTLESSTTATFGTASVAAGSTSFISYLAAPTTTVVSIVPASTNPTNAASVQFTVTFAASVTGVTASNFTTSNGTGVTGSSVTSVTGSGTTYTVTVNTGSGSGTLGLTLANDTNLTPSISNDPFTGTPLYTIDKTAPVPTVTSATAASGGTTSTSPFAYTVTFSETVTGFVAGDVTVTNGTLSGFSGSGTTYTFNVTPTTAGTVTDVTVAANTAQDAVGNNNVASNTYAITFTAPTIAVAPATLPNGTAGAAYSQTLTASGGTAPYSYAITAGALPAGLTLSSAGVLSGTPTAGGSFNFTVRATDASAAPGPYTGTRSYTLTIGAPTIALAPTTLPNGTVAAAYSQTITASGGTAPYSYAITAGALPAGLTLTSAGVLSGTPTVNGSFTFTVTATDASTGSGPYSGSRNYTLTIAAPATTTVASVTRLTPSPTATTQVSYRVVFAASVTGVTTSNFTTANSGTTVTGSSVSSVSGSGTTYTVVVNTGTGDGTLRLDVTNSTGISPTVSNVPYTAGETYTITKSFVAAPTLRIQAVGSASGNSDVTAFVDVVQVLQSGTSTAVVNGLQNGSFETNNVSPNSYLYQADGVVATPWTFGVQAGVSRNNSAFGSTAADGDAVTFLQSTLSNNGNVSQNLAVPTGSYQVRFRTIQRNYTSLDQRLNVFVNDVFVGTIQPNNIPTYDTFTSATFNVTAPALTATISSTAGASGSTTATSPIPYTVTFSASVTGFDASDVAVAGGTLSGFSGSGTTYTFNVTPSASGTVTVNVSANAAVDSNNTGNTAATQYSLIYAQPVTAAPVVTVPSNGSLISTTTPAYQGTAPASSLVTVYVDGASIGTTTATAGGSFSLTQPSALAQGSHTVYATAQTSGSAVSANSNTNTFSVDSVRPTVAISSSTATSGSTTSTSPFAYTITFSEAVTGFVAGDVTVSNGTLTGFAGSGSSYSFNVTPTTAGTATTVNIPANVAQDQAGNGNTAATQYSLTFVAPTITVAPASLPQGTQGTAYSQALSASGGSGTYTFAITAGALPAGLSLTNGTIAGTPTTNGTFTFTVTATDNSAAPGPYSGSRSYSLVISTQPVTATPVVIVPSNGSLVTTTTPTYAGTAPAGSTVRLYVDGVALSNTVTANSAGNWAITQPSALAQGSHTVYATAQTSGSAVSANSNTNTFTVDSVRPTVALSSSAGTNGSTTTTTPIPYTVTFSESVTGFVAGDVTVGNGTLSGFTGSGASYSFNVTPTTAGTATTVNVPANVAQDQAGNGNTAATQYSLTYQQLVTATPVVTAPANGSVLTTNRPVYEGTAPANSTVTVYVDNTAIGTTTATGGTFSLTQPTNLADGSHTVRATAQLSGNAVSASSNSNTFTIDTTAPTVVLGSTATNPTNTSPIPVTVTFSESVTGFVAGDVTVSNGTISGFSGSGSLYTFNVTPLAAGTVTVNVPANVAQDAAGNGNTAAMQFSITYVIPATFTTWTGSVSNDWFTAGNWTAGVPTATLDAIVPANVSRYPLVAANTATAKNLSINSGATVTQTDGVLDVRGNLTNNGTFAATGGTVALGASTQANILGSSIIRFWNLAAQTNGVQLSTSAGASVQRVLTLTGNLTTNGNTFTLLSSGTGDALVVNSGGVVAGTATVQRYIDPSLNAGLGARHYSAPVSNTTVADLATSGYTPVLNPAFNTADKPAQVRPFPTVFGYDQSRLTLVNTLPTFDKGFFSPTSFSDPLRVGQGYVVNIASTELVDFVGTLNNGDVTTTMASNRDTYTADGGWQLVGNPYPAPLDYGQVSDADRAGLDASLYVYSSTSQYNGQYRAYVRGVGGNSVVSSGQGFFVRVSSGQTTGSLTLRNAYRLTAPNATTFQRTKAETRPLVQLTLKGTGSISDDAYVYFENGATPGLDAQFDAVKMPNTTGLNLSTSINGQQLAIDGRAELGKAQQVVPLAVGVPTVGTYTFTTAQLLNLANVPVYLRDLQLGTVTDLRLTPSYQFTVTNASALITGRFELVFSPQQALATVPAALAQQVALYPNPAKKAAFVELPASLGRQAVTATFVDALGRQVRTVQLPAQGSVAHPLDLSDLATGVYALRLSTSAGVVVKKLVVE